MVGSRTTHKIGTSQSRLTPPIIAMTTPTVDIDRCAQASSAPMTIAMPIPALGKRFIFLDTAQSATLRYWAYPVSGEAQTVPQPAARLTGMKLDQYLWYDVQYALILDAAGTWIDTLYWACSNEQEWLNYTFDLSAYIGQTIMLHIGTYNNGSNGVTAMYYDDVSLNVCWGDGPTPTFDAGPYTH